VSCGKALVKYGAIPYGCSEVRVKSGFIKWCVGTVMKSSVRVR